MSQRNIYLVGMMGAGKSTTGRLLAKSLAREFVDLDQVLEARTGVTIATIFDLEGEAGFRQREAQVLNEIAHQSDKVVATGGGVVILAENRRVLQSSGLAIYLFAPPEQLFQRTQRDSKRPLLQVADPMARLVELCAERDPLYRQVAQLVVEPQLGGISHQVSYLCQEINKLEATGAAR